MLKNVKIFEIGQRLDMPQAGQSFTNTAPMYTKVKSWISLNILT